MSGELFQSERRYLVRNGRKCNHSIFMMTFDTIPLTIYYMLWSTYSIAFHFSLVTLVSPVNFNKFKPGILCGKRTWLKAISSTPNCTVYTSYKIVNNAYKILVPIWLCRLLADGWKEDWAGHTVACWPKVRPQNCKRAKKCRHTSRLDSVLF